MSLDLESLTEKRKQSDLLGYLLSLNFEHLKVVQTVMYIGRDYETMLQTECDDEYDEEYDEEDFSRNTNACDSGCHADNHLLRGISKGPSAQGE